MANKAGMAKAGMAKAGMAKAAARPQAGRGVVAKEQFIAAGAKQPLTTARRRPVGWPPVSPMKPG